MNKILSFIKKKSNFKGRISSAEYWEFVLPYGFFLFLSNQLMKVTQIFYEDSSEGLYLLLVPFCLVFLLVSVIFTIMAFSMTIKRLHDTNRNGWYLLLCLMPGIGWMLWLFYSLSEGKEEENYWGIKAK